MSSLTTHPATVVANRTRARVPPAVITMRPRQWTKNLLLLAGAAAVSVHASPWLLICAVLLALFLGFAKRRGELVLVRSGNGAMNPDAVVSTRRVAVVTAVVALAAAVVSTAQAARVEGPFGRGAAQVWIVLPEGPPRSVVVFGHGWKLAPPVPPLAWVDQFRPWLDHLASRGNAVVFPRYQVGANDSLGSARVLAYRRGLSTAFARLGRPHVPVVAAGYSYGASLAFYYAANAPRWRLPRPAAVDSVFPAGLIPGTPLPPLAPVVRVLIQVGDQDTEAGAAGASSFWAWLRGHPPDRKRYEVVASVPGLIATHAAPKQTGAAARRAFWQPLDALIAAARTGR
jgi:hypothetical protein